MKGKIIVLVFSLTLIVLFALLTGVYYWKNVRQAVTTIDSDTAISGDYLIKNNQTTVVKNGANLTVNGDLKVEGKLACDGGPLNLVVKGDLVVDNLLECDRKETDAIPNDIGSGISLVVEGSVAFNENSVIKSNGSVQIVESADLLAKTQEEIDKLFEEGPNQDLGFFSPKETVNVARFSNEKNFLPLKVAEAQGGNSFILLGDTIIDSSPKSGAQMVLNINALTKQVIFKNYNYYGADGDKGKDDKNRSCAAVGGKGGDAPALIVKAQRIELDGAKFTLGNGGEGGTAETPKEGCVPFAKATGGDGGKSGRFTFSSRTNITFAGTVEFHPGINGAGSNAYAYGGKGSSGCPGLPGGDATASGGKGTSHKIDTGIIKIKGNGGEYLSSNTLLPGAISFPIQGGRGGHAEAVGGEGGDGNLGCRGGDGGDAIATGGNGGDVSVKITKAIPGQGGGASASAGKGGNGGNCAPPLAFGGDGGTGGNAQAILGKSGLGPTGYGLSGVSRVEQGGDGGNGGDGEDPGSPGRPGKSGISFLAPKGGLPGDKINCFSPKPAPAPIPISTPPPVPIPTPSPAPTETEACFPTTCAKAEVISTHMNLCVTECEQGIGYETDLYLRYDCITSHPREKDRPPHTWDKDRPC